MMDQLSYDGSTEIARRPRGGERAPSFGPDELHDHLARLCRAGSINIGAARDRREMLRFHRYYVRRFHPGIFWIERSFIAGLCHWQ
jgi:hypothetical protein